MSDDLSTSATRLVLGPAEVSALLVLAGSPEAPGVLLPLPPPPDSPLDALRGTKALDASGRLRPEVREMLAVLAAGGVFLHVSVHRMLSARIESASILCASPAGPFVVANKTEKLRDLALLPGPAELLAFIDAVAPLAGARGESGLPGLAFNPQGIVALAACVDATGRQRSHADAQGRDSVELLLPPFSTALLAQQLGGGSNGRATLLGLLPAATGGRLAPEGLSMTDGLRELQALGLLDADGQASETGAIWLGLLGQTDVIASFQLTAEIDGVAGMGCLLSWHAGPVHLLGAFGEDHRLALAPASGADFVDALLALLEHPFLEVPEARSADSAPASREQATAVSTPPPLHASPPAPPPVAGSTARRPGPPAMPAGANPPALVAPAASPPRSSGCARGCLWTVMALGVLTVVAAIVLLVTRERWLPAVELQLMEWANQMDQL